jgi:hypothetical protein
MASAKELGAAEDKTAPPVTCGDLAVMITRLEENNSRDFQMLKRDLASLNQRLDEPGLQEIIGGIGTILGIFGAAAFVASRRPQKNKES